MRTAAGKNWLLYGSFLILFGPASAGASENNNLTSVAVFKEQEDENAAYGVTVSVRQNHSEWIWTDIGLSLSTISADRPIESGGRNRIYPIHGFFDVAIGKPMTFYGEFGADVGEIMTSELFGGEKRNIDFYYSAGVKATFQESINVSLYTKTYRMYFFDDVGRQDVVVSLRMVGASVGINF